MTDVFLYPVPGVYPDVDVILRDPTALSVPSTVFSSSGGGAGDRRQFLSRRAPKKEDPRPVIVAHSLYRDLGERYGPTHGRQVYFAMEREAKGPFAPGNKYDVTRRPPQPVDVATPERRVAVIPPAKGS